MYRLITGSQAIWLLRVPGHYSVLGTWRLPRQNLSFGQALASLPACGCHGKWVSWYMGGPSTNLAGFLTVQNQCHPIYEDFSDQKEETTVSKK